MPGRRAGAAARGEEAGGYPRIRLAGDAAVTVEWGERIDPETHVQVLRLWHALEEQPVPGMVEAVPTYRSVLVQWDPDRAERETVLAALDRAVSRARRRRLPEGRRVTIPVVYGECYGPDLQEVARYSGFSPGEVVRRHTEREYRVYMLGFMPGFAYLGGLDPALATPRRASPRLSVPAGSVAIGGEQTGIYALGGAPGGWQVIGRTWLELWDSAREPPALLQPGDRVRFEAVLEDRAPPEWVERARALGWEMESG